MYLHWKTKPLHRFEDSLNCSILYFLYFILLKNAGNVFLRDALRPEHQWLPVLAASVVGNCLVRTQPEKLNIQFAGLRRVESSYTCTLLLQACRSVDRKAWWDPQPPSFLSSPPPLLSLSLFSISLHRCFSVVLDFLFMASRPPTFPLYSSPFSDSCDLFLSKISACSLQHGVQLWWGNKTICFVTLEYFLFHTEPWTIKKLFDEFAEIVKNVKET